MITDFITWLAQMEMDEAYVNYFNIVPQPGDFVYFGVHDILDMPEGSPLDVASMGTKLGQVQGIDRGKLLVSPPQEHRFKALKPGRGGLIKVDPDHLKEITDRILGKGGMDVNPHTQAPRKLFMYTPKNYHSTLLGKKNRRMTTAQQQTAAQLQAAGSTPSDAGPKTWSQLFPDEQPAAAQPQFQTNAGVRDPNKVFRMRRQNRQPVGQSMSLAPTGTGESVRWFGKRLVGETNECFYPYIGI